MTIYHHKPVLTTKVFTIKCDGFATHLTMVEIFGTNIFCQLFDKSGQCCAFTKLNNKYFVWFP